jgi:hypothetical protein
VQERREMYTGLWWGNLKERDLLEAINGDQRVILKWTVNKQDERA